MLMSICKDNYTTGDNFRNNEYYPPGAENLEIKKETTFNSDLNSVPNKDQPMQSNESSQSNDNLHNTIYRTKTGREFYEQEHFVSIYDSNFGGYLGTTLGLNP